jgi:hypothetical protein
VWRKCGKPNCACAQPGHRGHGPQWNLTRRIGGKTVNVHLKPGPELDKVRREVAEHQRFADLVEEVSQVSEAICAARPVRAGPAPLPPGGEKGARGRASHSRLTDTTTQTLSQSREQDHLQQSCRAPHPAGSNPQCQYPAALLGS